MWSIDICKSSYNTLLCRIDTDESLYEIKSMKGAKKIYQEEIKSD